MELGSLRSWVRAEMARGSIAGAQIHLRSGADRADLVEGMARPSREMTSTTLVPWFSAGKPIAAIAAMRLAEEGELSLESPIATWLPEFRKPIHDEVTLRHLLSHTSGIQDPGPMPSGTSAQVITQAAKDGNRRDWPPGRHCSYTCYIEWYLVAAVLEAVTGKPLRAILNDTLRSLTAEGSSFGMTDRQFEEREKDITHLFQAADNVGWVRMQAMRREAQRCDRSGNALGSMRDLASVMAALLPGSWPSPVSDATRAEMITSQITGIDQHFDVRLSYGLGVMTDLRWRYGPRFSTASFGHVGSSVVGTLVDPQSSLVAAIFLNGRIRSTSLGDSTPRFMQAATALAEDISMGARL